MATKKREEPRLRRLSAIRVKLPEVERSVSGDHADFRLRGKVFSYFLNNHHGDGIAVCCKSALGENVGRVSREPKRFYLPAYIGARGWFGLRLDLATIDWGEFKGNCRIQLSLLAPKKLTKILDGGA